MDLFAGGHDGLVGGVELGEFGDQAVRRGEGLGLVQHEIAKEDVEVSQVLCRLGLVQELQRQFIVDPQQAAKAFRIGGELIASESVRKRLLQPADVQFEIHQLPQIEGTLEDQKVSPEIVLVVGGASYPEQLNQHDRAADRVAIRKGQPRPGCAGA